MSWLARFSNVFRGAAVSRRIDDEIAFHIGERIDELVEQGLTEDEAQAIATRQFGNPTLQKERTRDMDLLGWLETLGKDLRYGFRMLGRDRGFTTVAVLTLALGIGVNTAIFSLISDRLLRPLPYKNADRIVVIRETPLNNPQRSEGAAVPNFLIWKEQNHVFEEIGASNNAALSVTAEEDPELLTGLRIQPGYFETLGVKPILGRLISQEDCKPGNDEVIVLSHKLWLRRYGGDPHVLGKIVPAGLRNPVVIGVLPADFEAFGFGSLRPETEFWIPFAFSNTHSQSGTRYLSVLALLKPGIAIEQAQTEMDRIAANSVQANPKRNKGWGVSLVPMQEEVTGNFRQSLLTLQSAVAFVLLIACANVAGLLLARLSSRQQEIMVRSALGAARGRLVFQFLTESLLLSALSVPFALLIAYGGIKILAHYGPGGDFENIRIDGRVLAFTALLSVLTGLIFGLIPALQGSRRNLTGMLKDSGRAVTAGSFRQRLRSSLVVATIAIALVLLTGTGLMVNTFIRLTRIDPGFDTANLLTFQLTLPSGQYVKDAGASTGFSMMRPSPQIAIVFEQVLERLKGLPGVRSGALSDTPPLSGGNPFMEFTIDGSPRPEPGAQAPWANFHSVSMDFFRTLNVPVQGRPFDSRDSSTAPWVVIVNQSMARRYWPNANPIGRYLTFTTIGAEQPRQVIGVSRDMRYGSINDDSNDEMYVPHAQIPAYTRASFIDAYMHRTIILRTATDPMTIVSAARKLTSQAAGNRPISEIRTVEQYLDRQFQGPRFYLLLLGIFGATAVILAAVGIYGVMAYSVKVRTHEIGVRIALGASRSDALWLILRQGLTLTFIGVAIGVGGSLWLTRFIAGILYGVEPTDPVTFAIVAVTMIGVAVLACAIPGRRATNVDPAVALRHE